MVQRKKPASDVQKCQLPLWPESIRALPKAMAQSALFTVNCYNARRNFHREIIASQGDIKIIYTGEELRLDDEDVLLQLIHLARLQPLGDAITFSTYSIIKALSWSMNKQSYERLYDSIVRMKATNVTIQFTNAQGEWVEYHESLIESAEHGGKNALNKSDSLWRVRFHKRVLVLFADAAYTEVDWKTRLSLPPFAKKLHGLIISQEDPQGMSVDTLYSIMGSKVKQKKQFRYQLRMALKLLVEMKFLQTFIVDPTTDLVRVQRAPRTLSASVRTSA